MYLTSHKFWSPECITNIFYTISFYISLTIIKTDLGNAHHDFYKGYKNNFFCMNPLNIDLFIVRYLFTNCTFYGRTSVYMMFDRYFSYFIIFAKLSSSSVLVQSNLNWTLHYNHCKSHPPTHLATHPPTPGKYIWATSRLPSKLKFGIEALLNQTRSIS